MTLFHITWLPYAGFVTWLLSCLLVFIVWFLLRNGQEIGLCLCYPFLYYVWGKLIKFFQSALNSEQWNWIWLRDYTDTYISFFWLGLRQWHPTPVLLPGKSHGWRSLVGCSPWGRKELDTTERLHFHFSLSCIGEGNGNPLQCSCLENPSDRGAWWAAISGVAQSRTRLSNFNFTHWRRQWQPTPVFLPGESQGWGNLVGCRLWGRTESDTTEVT